MISANLFQRDTDFGWFPKSFFCHTWNEVGIFLKVVCSPYGVMFTDFQGALGSETKKRRIATSGRFPMHRVVENAQLASKILHNTLHRLVVGNKTQPKETWRPKQTPKIGMLFLIAVAMELARSKVLGRPGGNM